MFAKFGYGKPVYFGRSNYSPWSNWVKLNAEQSFGILKIVRQVAVAFADGLKLSVESIMSLPKHRQIRFPYRKLTQNRSHLLEPYQPKEPRYG